MNTITVEEVAQALAEDNDTTLIDVRTAQEYGMGHIKGSMNVELKHLNKTIKDVISDKKKKVCLYCLSGSRSEQAVAMMEKAGYASVFNITSGLLAWRAKGFPLVK